MMRTSHVVLSLLILLVSLPVFTPQEAKATPVSIHQWIPDEAEHVFVLQNLDHLKNQVDLFQNLKIDLKKSIPIIAQAKKHMDQIDWKNNDFGGFHFKRGIGVFMVTPARQNPHFRLVVGVNDVDRFIKSILQHITDKQLKKLRLKISKDGFSVGPVKTRCGVSDGWWVCDSMQFKPPQKNAIAEQFSTQSVLWSYIGTTLPPLARMLKRKPMFKMVKGVSLKSMYTETSQSVVLKLHTSKHPLSQVLTKGLNQRGLKYVHELSPFTAHFQVPLQELIKEFGKMFEPQIPPPFKSLWRASKAALNGEINLSFAGSLLRPVLSIGVLNKEAAELFLREVGQLTQLPFKRGDGVRELIVQPPRKPVKFKLSYDVTQHVIQFAAHPADLQRHHSGKRFSALQFPKGWSQSNFALHFTGGFSNFIEAYRVLLSFIYEVPIIKSHTLFTQIGEYLVEANARLFDASLWLQTSPDGATLIFSSRSFPKPSK